MIWSELIRKGNREGWQSRFPGVGAGPGGGCLWSRNRSCCPAFCRVVIMEQCWGGHCVQSTVDMRRGLKLRNGKEAMWWFSTRQGLHLLSSCYVQATLLDILCVLTYFILTIVYRVAVLLSPNWCSQWGTEGLRILPKILLMWQSQGLNPVNQFQGPWPVPVLKNDSLFRLTAPKVMLTY